MADYGLDPSITSYIQGGGMPDVQPTTFDNVPADALHPNILNFITGGAPQGDIYMGGPRGAGDDSGIGAPPPPPPPPPPPSSGTTKGPMKELAAPPIAPGLAGAPQAAPEVTDTVPSVTGGNLPTEPTSLTPPPQQPDIVANPTVDGANLIPQYNQLGDIRPLGPGEFVKNKNGSWSNEITTTVQDSRINGGKPTVIPTLWVVNGKPTRVSEDQATDFAAQSGLYFPGFGSMKDAEGFANKREANWQKVGEGDTSGTPALWSQTPRATPPTAAQQAKAAAFAASPEGIAEQADQVKMAAVNQGQQAIDTGLAGEEAQNNAIAKAQSDFQKQQAAAAQTAAAKQAQDQAVAQHLTQQWTQQVQDAANYNVNTNRDVGMGGLIAIALSGIGDALDHYHGPNAAAQIIDAGIQKRISDQWDQKNALYKKADATKSELDQSHNQLVDDRTQQQLDLAAAHTQMADQIDAIKTQYANPQAQARAGALSADQRMKAADIIQGAATRKAGQIRDAQDLALKKQQVAQGWAGLAQSDKHFTAQLAQQRQEHDDQVALEAAKLAQEGQKEKAAALLAQNKALSNGGMMAPTGGTTVVKNDDGTTSKQPAYDYMINDDNTPWIMSQEYMKETNPYKVRASAEKAINAIDDLRKLRDDSGGDYTNYSVDANQKVAELQRATMALMGTFGGNASPRSAEILKQIQTQLTGTGDATSKIQAIEPILKQARGDIISDLDTTYRAGGYRGKNIGYQYPDPLANKGTKTAQDIEDQDVLKATVPAADEDLIKPGGFVKYLATPESRALYSRANQAGVFPSQLQALDKYGTDLKNPDPSVSGAALARLQGIVGDQKYPQGVRDIARQYLGAHLEQQLPSSPVAPPQSPLPAPVAHYIASRLPEGK